LLGRGTCLSFGLVQSRTLERLCALVGQSIQELAVVSVECAWVGEAHRHHADRPILETEWDEGDCLVSACLVLSREFR
jgi:hypothetical protein